MEPSLVDGLIQTGRRPPPTLRENLQLARSSTWGPCSPMALLGTPSLNSMSGQRSFLGVDYILGSMHLKGSSDICKTQPYVYVFGSFPECFQSNSLIQRRILSAVALTLLIAPKDYVAAMSRLSAHTIYWNSSKTFSKYGSFTHPKTET